MKAYGRTLDRRELRRRTGDTAAVGGIRQVVLEQGDERGVRLVEFHTTTGLSFDVVVDRAMDLGAARHAGRPFGWRSGVGFRHPGLHDGSAEDGLAWLRAMDGLLVSGGLDHTLFAARTDAAHHHYPPRSTQWRGLHGPLSTLPASLDGAGEAWDGDQCVLWVEGTIRQAAVFGEQLQLQRRIEADLDGDEIRIFDTVTNVGFDRTPHMFLYHVNLGWPLVDEGTEVTAAIRNTRWSSPSTQTQDVPYHRIPAPQRDFVEQVYEHELVSGQDGCHRVVVARHDQNFGVELCWDASGFPHFFEWLHLREGGYAIGLEPSTHHVEGAQAARDDGSIIWLEHGQSRSYRTTLRVLGDQSAVHDALSDVRRIEGSQEGDRPSR